LHYRLKYRSQKKSVQMYALISNKRKKQKRFILDHNLKAVRKTKIEQNYLALLASK